MIRFIAAIDNKQGLANESGIPWQGKLPSEVKYFRDTTMGHTILMGYGTYVELKAPLPDRHNVVASSKHEALRDSFELVHDARIFVQNATEDIWVIGGAGLFTQLLDLADELYITQLTSDFQCTKFFPEFKSSFTLKSRSDTHTENNINYSFEVWQKTQST